MKYISLFLFLFYCLVFINAIADEIYIGPFEATGFIYPPTNVYNLISNSTNLFKQMGLSVKPKPHLFSNNVYIQDGSIPEKCPYPPAWAPGTTNHHPEVMNIVSYYTFTKWGKKFINFGIDYPRGSVTRFGNSKQCITNTPSCNIAPIVPIESIEIMDDGFTKSGASSIDYDPLANVGKFTIMAWVYRNDKSDSQLTASRIVSDLAGTKSGPGFQLRFAGIDGKLQLSINPDKSSDNYVENRDTSQYIPPDSKTWYHVAVSFDNSKPGGSLDKSTVNMYVNGNISTSLNKYSYKTGDHVSSNNSPFTIGCSSGADTYSGQFVGFLDDIIIFKDWVPSSTNDVIYWMNASDYKHRQMDIDEGITFGTFTLSKYLYSAEQVTNIIKINNPTIEFQKDVMDYSIPYGQFNPTNEIYGCDEVDNLVEDK